MDLIQIHLKREERDYSLTLKGPLMDLSGVKFPAHSGEGEEGLLFERMYLYEDLWFCLGQLYEAFAKSRVSEEWEKTVLPGMKNWIRGEE